MQVVNIRGPNSMPMQLQPFGDAGAGAGADFGFQKKKINK